MARATTSIAQEKTHKKEAKLMKNGYANFFGKGGREGSKNFDHKFYKSKQPNATKSFDKTASICLYDVLPIKLAKVTKVHVLMQELLK